MSCPRFYGGQGLGGTCEDHCHMGVYDQGQLPDDQYLSLILTDTRSHSCRLGCHGLTSGQGTARTAMASLGAESFKRCIRRASPPTDNFRFVSTLGSDGAPWRAAGSVGASRPRVWPLTMSAAPCGGVALHGTDAGLNYIALARVRRHADHCMNWQLNVVFFSSPFWLEVRLRRHDFGDLGSSYT
ncbi:hypothetical protein PoB_007642300 [Plakobranchus ocellatus]|uniref:Uncharacterized protein n=1 Tax=Plakobranchus ocellatus TaxID=259542 RepID=A0AAV4E011_9GAST|nr:hypothetical protein PoB_007642300 [Plakobranchus ocellatus]